MRNLNLKEEAQKHIDDAGEVKAGMKRFVKKFTEQVIEDKDIPSTSFSIKEIFEATTLKENPDLDPQSCSQKELTEALNGSQFPQLTRSLIHRVMVPAYEDGLQSADMLVTELDTQRYDQETMVGTTAISTLPRVYPGQPYPAADFGEKYFTISFANFGQILDVQKELILSDQTGTILDRANQAGMVMGQHRHRFIVETLINAPRDAMDEATSTACVYKGTALTASQFFANTHATYDGQVNDNLAASSPLGTTGMDTAMGLLGTMTDEKGRYINIMPKVLVHHPTLNRTAWSLLNDIDLSTVDSGNRGKNYYQKFNIAPFATPYVTSNSGNTTDWYIGDPKRALVWMWYIRPTTDTQGSDSNSSFERNVVFRAKCMYWAGCAYRDNGRFLVKATA